MNQAIAKTAPRVSSAGASIRAWPRINFALANTMIVLTALSIEALLAFRAWIQLSGSSLGNIFLRLLYTLSSELVAPFRGLETTSPVRTSRVLELSTLVAMEAYLIAAVLGVAGLLAVRALMKKAESLASSEGQPGALPTTSDQAAVGRADRTTGEALP